MHLTRPGERYYEIAVYFLMGRTAIFYVCHKCFLQKTGISCGLSPKSQKKFI